MSFKRIAIATLFCWTFALASSPLFGQATGSLSGTIQDRSGAVLPGATVTATSQGTSASRETKTDDTGHYLIPLLPVGVYSIQVTAEGFQPINQKDVTLQVDESKEVDFSMSPATVQQSVEVSATAVAVNTSNASLGQVITAQQVAELPLNGRNFVQLATLTPGTVQETNPNSFFNGGGSSEVGIRGSYSLSVGGSRPNSTDWLLDGVDNNELTAGGIAILPDIDALQEFKVLTYNYSAEYGTRGGPAVLLTIKSGSNKVHGSLFEYLRNTSLDARSFFAQNREVFIQNQYGGSIGGPVRKDKTFLFLDFQGKQTRQGKVFVGQVPTDKMKAGDFSESFTDAAAPASLSNPNTNFGFPGGSPFLCDGAGNPSPTDAFGVQSTGTPCAKIPSSVFNSVGKALVDLYPAANNLSSGLLSQDYINTPVKQFKDGQADARLDHNFSSQDSLFARFSYDQATEFLPGGSPGYAEPNAFSSTQSLTNHGRNAALGETHVFSSNTLNKVTLGYNRIFNHIISFGGGSCLSSTIGGGIPGANLGGVSCGLTSVLVTSGFWSLGDRGFAPFQGGTNVFHIADSFDMVRGNHDMTFGGEIRANQMNVLTNAFQDGFYVVVPAFTGNAIGDLLLGLPVFGQHDQTFQGTVTGRRWKMYRPFFEDNWRVRPNLTVNLGLAWALVTPITEAHNRQSNFNFQTGEFLIGGGNGGSTVGLTTDKTAFEPRIGIAWSPSADRKTSLRAGFAIYHDSSWNQGAQGLWENPPYFGSSIVPFGNTFSQGFPILSPPASGTTDFSGNFQTQNLNFKQGRIIQYNFDVERQIPGDILLTVGYAGSRGTHILEGGQNINIMSPAACGVVTGYTLGCGLTGLPFPTDGTINDIFDNGSATYNSLQIKAETKSRKHGLYALIGYTYSKSVDNGLSDGLGSNIGAMYFPLPNIGTGDKAVSQIDLAHNFTASIIYDLPFGKGKPFGSNWSAPVNAVLGNWEFDVIEHAISGFPMFLVSSNGGGASGVGFANNGNNYSRPDRVCNGRISSWTVDKYFDASCFADPVAGELGNSNRGPLFGPGLVNTDFSAVKNFPLSFREGMALQFRAEFFNIWNHAQFLAPGAGVVDIDGVGPARIGATVNNPRLIQFALKLRF
jgi:Carboxypeptidase regulatory-like domain